MNPQFLHDYLATSGLPIQRNQAVIALLAWDLLDAWQQRLVYEAFVSPANSATYA